MSAKWSNAHSAFLHSAELTELANNTQYSYQVEAYEKLSSEEPATDPFFITELKSFLTRLDANTIDRQFILPANPLIGPSGKNQYIVRTVAHNLRSYMKPYVPYRVRVSYWWGSSKLSKMMRLMGSSSDSLYLESTPKTPLLFAAQIPLATQPGRTYLFQVEILEGNQVIAQSERITMRT